MSIGACEPPCAISGFPVWCIIRGCWIKFGWLVLPTVVDICGASRDWIADIVAACCSRDCCEDVCRLPIEMELMAEAEAADEPFVAALLPCCKGATLCEGPPHDPFETWNCCEEVASYP